MNDKKTILNKSPFPGMDPYLEGDMWQEFHQTFAQQIRAQLMVVLPSNYVALLEKYCTFDYSGASLITAAPKGIYPDTHMVKVKEAAITYEVDTPEVTLPENITPPAVELISPIPHKTPVLRVEIRETAERRLVTIIEILSPANKYGRGYQKYLKKRVRVLKSSIHLLEIDLLRAGERIPLVGGALPPAPYYIFLSRFTHRPYTEVWPVQLRQPLPAVPVPLLPPDPDVALSLQKAINACFELVRYHERLLDYSQSPPEPPFNAEDAAWVESVARRYSDF
jgi:hypothetical protein